MNIKTSEHWSPRLLHPSLVKRTMMVVMQGCRSFASCRISSRNSCLSFSYSRSLFFLVLLSPKELSCPKEPRVRCCSDATKPLGSSDAVSSLWDSACTREALVDDFTVNTASSTSWKLSRVKSRRLATSEMPEAKGIALFLATSPPPLLLDWGGITRFTA